MNDDRDLQLGDAINALPVPPRDDEFMTDLERRLEVADAERSPAGAEAPGHRLSGWFARRRRQWVLVAAAAAAVVLGLALFGPGRGVEKNGVGPEPATAAQIIRSSLAATGGGRSLRGVVLAGVVRGGRFRVNVREKFIVSDDGSVAIRGRAKRNGGSAPLADYLPGATFRAAYDASARVATYVWHFSTPQRAVVDRNGKVRRFTFSDQAVVSRHLAAGPPADSPLDEELPLARLRANMLQLVAGGSASSASVRDIVVDGRPAWSISTTQLAPGNAPVPPGTPVTLVIDKATRLPVVYRWTYVASRPHQVFELRFVDLVVGGEVSPGTFTPRVPAHAWITPGAQDFGRPSSQATAPSTIATLTCWARRSAGNPRSRRGCRRDSALRRRRTRAPHVEARRRRVAARARFRLGVARLSPRFRRRVRVVQPREDRERVVLFGREDLRGSLRRPVRAVCTGRGGATSSHGRAPCA